MNQRTLCMQFLFGGLAAIWSGAILAASETPSAADVQRQNQAINQALTLAAPVKARIEDYRRHHDDFPSSNAEAAIGPPAGFVTSDVREIAIDRGGVINITLTQSSGVDGGRIVLTPNLPKNTDNYAVEWKCTSPSYSTISDATLGLCEYTKVP